jgi:hypothetical protein
MVIARAKSPTTPLLLSHLALGEDARSLVTQQLGAIYQNELLTSHGSMYREAWRIAPHAAISVRERDSNCCETLHPSENSPHYAFANFVEWSRANSLRCRV